MSKLTYAHIDLDAWVWAIVTDYHGPQDFGEIIAVVTDEEGLPLSEYKIKPIIAALSKGNYDNQSHS